MSFSDLIKKSVLERIQLANLSTTEIVFSLGVSVLLGLFIFFVYRFNAKSEFYQRGFNKSLAVLPVITTAIIMAMGTNLTISLGMVGALSIVRFRNAVKNPSDLTYLFWSISVGIVVGANLIELAFILSAVITVLVFGIDMLPTFRAPCLLIISAEEVGVESELMASIKEFSKTARIRSRNIGTHSAEWIIELRVHKELDLIKKISEIPSIMTVQMMSHDGELRV